MALSQNVQLQGKHNILKIYTVKNNTHFILFIDLSDFEEPISANFQWLKKYGIAPSTSTSTETAGKHDQNYLTYIMHG